jgi:hypothetical protein
VSLGIDIILIKECLLGKRPISACGLLPKF